MDLVRSGFESVSDPNTSFFGSFSLGCSRALFVGRGFSSSDGTFSRGEYIPRRGLVPMVAEHQPRPSKSPYPSSGYPRTNNHPIQLCIDSSVKLENSWENRPLAKNHIGSSRTFDPSSPRQSPFFLLIRKQENCHISWMGCLTMRRCQVFLRTLINRLNMIVGSLQSGAIIK